eukprot:412339_1
MGKCVSNQKEHSNSSVDTIKKVEIPYYDRFNPENIKIIANGMYNSRIDGHIISNDILELIAKYHQLVNICHVKRNTTLRLQNKIEHIYDKMIIDGKLTVNIGSYWSDSAALLKLKVNGDILVSKTGSINVSNMGWKENDRYNRAKRSGGTIRIRADGVVKIERGGSIKARGGRHRRPRAPILESESDYPDGRSGKIYVTAYKIIKNGIIDASGRGRYHPRVSVDYCSGHVSLTRYCN